MKNLGKVIEIGSRMDRARADLCGRTFGVCEIDLEVIAILYVPENPTSSMAIVGDKGSSLVRIGSWVGDRRVVQMAARSLVLGPLEDPCVMRLTDRSPQRRVSPRRRVRKRRRR